MLRIIAGSLKGRRFFQPDTALTRPTTDRAKEAIFNILTSIFYEHNQTWDQHSVIDFFAGSGSLVFEALSRGARNGTLIDKGAEALRTLLKNCQILKLEDKCLIHKCDVTKLPKANKRYSLIFLDPPYALKNFQHVVDSIIANGWLENKAWLVFELHYKAVVPVHLDLEIITERLYGQIKIVIARYNAKPPLTAQ